MVAKLRLPFPILSDPDRRALIEPFGVADTRDPRNIARPAMVLLRPGGEEAWRFESRDFADRLPEADALDRVRELGLEPTTQPPPEIGPPQPGPRAMSLEALIPYFRGARFAALAMGLRHRRFSEEIAEDSKAYVEEMDRFTEAIQRLLETD
jgi:hypothetical protein